MKTKALFLDRDGVINIDKKYVHKQEDFEFCEGIFPLCDFFIQEGFKIFVITNQSGIARGYYTEADFAKLSQFMCESFKKQGIEITKIYHCPHLENCECRKPKPGMLLKAQLEFDINMQNAVFIGDNLSDMQAGLAAKVGTLVLLSEDKNLKKDLKKGHFEICKNLSLALVFLKKKLKG
ncbi:D-glycero-beta-D-manno-heptose 1,7-bisphosphate 7-phosphatase [Campylobacter sp. MIT 97-5078]|uniref:D-glycero-beta-D-manno-heptose 1,7-bisphosphate 7-phosphatase n=1 Tax=Campylobacter sp. MIT 97-5078 TaxID=1548153 RepID=UPI0005144DB7|nr:D-glycero-beta-D-manno-heptose 1,7-bisphosphate 7-phosphatase [Campylobacter sp. MIT 97-5078]KGI55327.1 D,D-heptose 1,7-bisphosphate phosphatase [Campylobacter sp. MIT 97-5078]TQR27100.1 D-glycero-beta-D-manno-heptose-1,7-bisphosphate 7-phosphatase [Campylobacter sp. MIT 97-5078]